MGDYFVNMKRRHVPIFGQDIGGNGYFIIPTRKKIGNVTQKRNPKKCKMQVIGFAQTAVVPQNTSHIEKSKGSYEIKEVMGVREKGNPEEALSIEKLEGFQQVQGSEKQKSCQITVCGSVSLIEIQDKQGQK